MRGGQRDCSVARGGKDLKNVIIAGGGTGGHIYPGVAIARVLEANHPDIRVHFVGARGGLEEKIVPREGFPLHTVPVGRLHHSVGLKTRVMTLLTLPFAFLVAVKILLRLKPVAVLGVGGFASGPMLFVAALFGFRSVIWEPNAYPGMANRLLARWVDECLLVFEAAGQHLKAKRVTASGLPVRATMKPAAPRTEADDKRPLRILVFGGSQGARFINNLVIESAKQDGWLEGVELVHQTGSADYGRLKEVYKDAPPGFQVFEYLHDMDERYQWADLVICRAGASTVAEIGACRKAAIFIPLPTAADDHQRKNAEVLARADAAMMCLQSDLRASSFRKTLESLRDDRSRLRQMETNVQKFQFPNAAEKIVERLLDSKRED